MGLQGRRGGLGGLKQATGPAFRDLNLFPISRRVCFFSRKRNALGGENHAPFCLGS
jgi:hypothetical protein